MFQDLTLFFFVRINDCIYPVFVQLKLRQVLEPSDVEKALETVSSQAVQRKTEKELKKMVKELKKMVKEQDKAEKEQDKVEKE